jgi:hypothetical protein
MSLPLSITPNRHFQRILRNITLDMRPLGRPRRRWEDNIKTALRDVDWIHWVQDRDRWRAPVNTVMKLRVP